MALTLASLFPGLAARRLEARARLEVARRLYEAAKPSNYHKPRGVSRSGNSVVDHSRGKLRDLARDLEENHDLAVGVLDTLVNNVVGTGIAIEPMVRVSDDADAELDEATNEEIRRAWRAWSRAPEVTGQLPCGEMQRIVCRTWLRDGEVLVQHVMGTQPGISYASDVPYALELIESDYLPYDLIRSDPTIIHGVELNAWGRPSGYYLYREHPGDTYVTTSYARIEDTKRVDAQVMTHLAFRRRIKQVRGVSIFHSVFRRLDDIRDYEESERVAARVAAAMCGYIRKTDLATGVVTGTSGERLMEMAPGQIFDNLLPGEEVGTIGHDRPNSNLEPFRNAMLRAVAAGTGPSYSSIARTYDGTYSAQRQELVESAPNYTRLRELFVERFLRDVYERFVDSAILSGALQIPASAGRTAYDADYRGPSMPWIDPLKEVQADELRISVGLASRHQVIRERGGDPIAVDKQRERERAMEPEPQQVAEPMQDEDSDDEQPTAQDNAA